MFLDQLALRGGQSEHFLQLSRSPFYAEDLWRIRPNIEISSALAEFKLKQVEKCRTSLKICVEAYPWIFPRLFQELSIDHVPKSVWGKTPPTERDKFECELYVHNAKDLWNTPEVISFLVEVVESAEVAPKREIPRTDSISLSHGPITLDEARHVLLSGIPSLINFLPRKYTTMPTSSSDPLPPPDNVRSYDPAPATEREGTAYQPPFDTPPEDDTPNPRSAEENQRGVGEAQDLQGVQGFFHRFRTWIGSGRNPEQIDADPGASHDRAAELGIPEELITEAGQQMELLGGRDAAGTALAPEVENANPVGATLESEPESGQSGEHDGQDTTAPSETAPDHALATEGSTRGPPIEEEPYDDNRNQRWLAGQGMLRLRDFCIQHGTDESSWDSVVDDGIVIEYAQRVMQLRRQSDRNFIMDYPLTQGTSREVKALVEREIQRARL